MRSASMAGFRSLFVRDWPATRMRGADQIDDFLTYRRPAPRQKRQVVPTMTAAVPRIWTSTASAGESR